MGVPKAVRARQRRHAKRFVYVHPSAQERMDAAALAAARRQQTPQPSYLSAATTAVRGSNAKKAGELLEAVMGFGAPPVSSSRRFVPDMLSGSYGKGIL